MCKGCNSVIRVFSLPISEHAMDYIDRYRYDDRERNGDVDDEYILSCGDIVLLKVGYDENKKPLYNFLVGDGSRPIKDLGYIVPVGTKPAFGLNEVEDPMCLGEMMTRGIEFSEGIDAIGNEEICEAFCPNIEDELGIEPSTDYNEADIIAQDKDGKYVVKQKLSGNGDIIIQSTDIKF